MFAWNIPLLCFPCKHSLNSCFDASLVTNSAFFFLILSLFYWYMQYFPINTIIDMSRFKSVILICAIFYLLIYISTFACLSCIVSCVSDLFPLFVCILHPLFCNCFIVMVSLEITTY